ncbi:MAG: phage holin family protein [Gammaproteobacteria bacterium]|nr:phage holin family protein [Gammaproteobacteria bacterium]
MLRFVVFWGLNTLLLWVAAELFASVHYEGLGALFIAGLLFGIAHAVIKPVLVILTLPVTVLTLGLFLLVINALILLLVAFVVPGFDVTGFWPAVGVALFISVLSLVLNMLFGAQLTK